MASLWKEFFDGEKTRPDNSGQSVLLPPYVLDHGNTSNVVHYRERTCFRTNAITKLTENANSKQLTSTVLFYFSSIYILFITNEHLLQ